MPKSKNQISKIRKSSRVKVPRGPSQSARSLGPTIRKSPEFRSTSKGTEIHFSEFVSEIYGSEEFNLNAFHLNPGDQSVFRWLSERAWGYEFYNPLYIRARFQPYITDFESGIFYSMTEYDPKDPAPDTKTEVLTNSSHIEGRISKEKSWTLHLDSLRKPTPIKKVRFSETFSVDDIDMYDMGTFYIGAQVEQQASRLVGHLYFDYGFIFSEPQTNHIDSAAGLSIQLSTQSTDDAMGFPFPTEQSGDHSELVVLNGQEIFPSIANNSLTLLLDGQSNVSATSLIKKAGDYLLEFSGVCTAGDFNPDGNGIAFRPYFCDAFGELLSVDDPSPGVIEEKDPDTWIYMDDILNITRSIFKVSTTKDDVPILALSTEIGDIPVPWSDQADTATYEFAATLLPLAHTFFTNYLTTKPFSVNTGLTFLGKKSLTKKNFSLPRRLKGDKPSNKLLSPSRGERKRPISSLDRLRKNKP